MIFKSVLFLVAMVASVFSVADDNGAEATKGEMWVFVVNNAKRTAEAYAVDKNPKSTFNGLNPEVEFIKQYGGEYKGRYLLKIVNKHGSDISFAVLLPLFDENQTSDNLDDESNLWKVVSAKHNGALY